MFAPLPLCRAPAANTALALHRCRAALGVRTLGLRMLGACCVLLLACQVAGSARASAAGPTPQRYSLRVERLARVAPAGTGTVATPPERVPGGGKAVDLSPLAALGAMPVAPPIKAALLTDAADGRLDEHGLVEAGLIASGVVQRAELARHLARFEQWKLDVLDRAQQRSPSAARRLEYLYRCLHDELLTGGYEHQATSLVGLLEQGRFNCVSSTIVLHELCRDTGIEAAAVETPEHVFSQVLLPPGPLDVQTTCPEWFELIERSARQRSDALEAIGLPATECAPRRTLSEAGLVAIVYYNAGVDALRVGDFQTALDANADAIRLDPHSAAAWANLLAALNNWALQRSQQGQYPEALALLRAGRALDAEHTLVAHNLAVIADEWSTALVKCDRADEAIALLSEACALLPDEPRLSRRLQALFFEQARTALRAGDMARGLAYLDSARGRAIDPASSAAAETALFVELASEWTDRAHYRQALDLLQIARSRCPHDEQWTAAWRSAASAWAGAALAQRDFVEAIRRVTYRAESDRPDPALAPLLRAAYDGWTSQLLAQGRTGEADLVRRQAAHMLHIVDGSGTTLGTTPWAGGGPLPAVEPAAGESPAAGVSSAAGVSPTAALSPAETSEPATPAVHGPPSFGLTPPGA